MILPRSTRRLAAALVVFATALSVVAGDAQAAVEPGRAGAPASVKPKKPGGGKAKSSPAAKGASQNPASPYVFPGAVAATSEIDRLVFARLAELGIPTAPLCSDAVFVRRVYLDVIGTLPTAAETRQFLQDRAPDKRSALIDRLLVRDEFTDYWTMRWSDLLRVKAEFPINLWPNAAQAYHRWIHTAVRDNLPYDQFARALLTSNGSNFRVGPVNFYRAVQNRDAAGLARAVALTFMGVRAEKWSAEQQAALAVFFSRVGFKSTGEWKEEIVHFDSANRTAGGAMTATFPDGKTTALSPDRDPREVFTEWLLEPSNPWFARAVANRAWSWLLGRGIVHEPDDIRPDNPPANPALLAHLEKEVRAAKYDLKQLFRLILNSRVYQLSSIAASDHPQAEANFAHYAIRRLDAEVLVDALNQITGGTERYSSAIPEPFTFIPEDQRSIALPDGSITSSVLETFGRPPRDTGLESERNNRITANQRLHLLNSTHVQRKIEQGGRLQALIRPRGNPREVVDALYFTIVSRPPTPAELDTALEYFRSSAGDLRTAGQDLAWALINSAEFLHRH